MAASKEDIKYGAAQAKVTDDDMLRTGYINGTPLEGGKIADSSSPTHAASPTPSPSAPLRRSSSMRGWPSRPVVDAAWAAKPSSLITP